MVYNRQDEIKNDTVEADVNGSQAWLKHAINFAPVVVFFVSFFIFKRINLADPSLAFVYATGVLVAASIVAIIVSFWVEKRLAWIPLIATIFAVPFGILTFIFKDPSFIKIKVTVVCLIFAAVLFGALLMKKNLLKSFLGQSLNLKDEAWPKLTLYYGLFYLATGLANEWVWRTQSDAFWVSWKLGSMIGGPIIFSVLLVPFMMKNMIIDEEKVIEKITRDI